MSDAVSELASARDLVQLLRDAADVIAHNPTAADTGTEVRAALRVFVAAARHTQNRGDKPETRYSQQARREAAAGDGSDEHEPMPVNHPLLDGLTPVFPELAIEVRDLHVEATAVFGPAFEGPPGLVHGGFVSAGFDIVVSLAAAQLLPWAMTRRLKIRFLRPTYLGDRLTFAADAEAGEGRSIRVVAKLRDGNGKTTASAESEFVTFEPERFANRQGFCAELS